MNVSDLPTLNAILNGLSLIFLVTGYIRIRRGRRAAHMRSMLGALASSALFLISYLIYHSIVGSVPYPHHDWTRAVYFVFLVPHIILAALMVPFILAAVYYAWRGEFARHTRITRRLWPVWVFVSVSGIIVYVMLYLL